MCVHDMLSYDKKKSNPQPHSATQKSSKFSVQLFKSKSNKKNRKIMPKKNGRRESVNDEEENAKALQEMIEKLHERQNWKKQHEDKWKEACERKIVEDEKLEDLKACCAPDEYFPAARAQTNVWLQVSHERNTQRVQLSFMNVGVPKPKCPPLPYLPPMPEPPKPVEEEKSNGKKKKKK